MSGIEESLANKLKTRGVIVKGEILPDFNHDNSSLDETTDASELSDEEFLEDRLVANSSAHITRF